MVTLQRINVPILLTLIRLVASPIILPFLIAYLVPFNIFFINFLLALIFVGFSLTDFFDGYLARKLKQQTHLGALLDPIADKILTCSVLIALVVTGKLFFYWAVLLICREFFVMGLRQMALQHQKDLPVLYWGKIKTAVQMIFLTLVIINPYGDAGFFEHYVLNSLQLLLLVTAIALSLWSAYIYYDQYMAMQIHFSSGDLASICDLENDKSGGVDRDDGNKNEKK